MRHRTFRKTVQIVLLLALFLQLLPISLAEETAAGTRYTQVELYAGDKALDTANLENYVTGGAGYRFGYYDEARGFVELGRTEQITISMLKTHNIYFDKNKYYTTSVTEYGAVGCHHVQLPESYSDFASAKAAADAAGGFVAWISGTYYVRVGHYTTAALAAQAAQAYTGATLGETSRYGITVTVTRTDTILFQFDDEGKGTGLGVEPDLTGAADRQTWFKGQLYRGGFRYQRMDGNCLTVVNMLEQTPPDQPEVPDVPDLPEVPDATDTPPQPESGGARIRVGLYYGDSALDAANLENYSGFGSGYRFGYYNESSQFVELGRTDRTAVSILKTHNIYIARDKTYTTSPTSYGVVGCYHVQLHGSYASFAAAKAAADSVGGFVAWIGGAYYVRKGSYVSAGQAAAAAGGYTGATVGETSRYGISVTVTGTDTILFQFDDQGKGTGLGVEPDVTGAADRQTWFKDVRYRGGFRYQRLDGNRLTVVNVVELENYVKGVVPYEMSPSWALEALKAQAVCARTYVLSHLNKHRTYGFDVCTGQECQVYGGVNRENASTAAATEETSGLTIKYDGKYIDAVFSASNGGASESAKNVWGTEFGYLQGVEDPYEATIADKISDYSWTRTLTGTELQQRLIARGNTRCGVIVAVSITKTETGNVYSMTFTDVNGRNWTIYRETCRTALGMRSQRFDLLSAKSEGPIYVNGEQAAGNLYVVDGSGEVTQLDGSWSILTESGVENASGSSSTSANQNGSFDFAGTGYGHNVGLSQWGARAMAELGHTYREILTFYYTGVTIEG